MEVRRVEEKSEAGESTFPFSYGDVVVTIDGLDVIEGAGEVSAVVDAANKLGKATVGVLKENAGELIMVTIGGRSGGRGGGGAGAAGMQAGGESWKQLLEAEEWVAGELGGSDYDEELPEEGEDGHVEDEKDDENEAKTMGEAAAWPRAGAHGSSTHVATVEVDSSSTAARAIVKHDAPPTRGAPHPSSSSSSSKTPSREAESPLHVVSGLSNAILRRILLGVLTRERDAEAELVRVLGAATAMCREGWAAGGAPKLIQGTVVHFLVEHTRPEVGF